MGAARLDRELRQIMQKVNGLSPLSMGRLLALAGFWLVLQGMAFLLYMAAFPDFMLLHDIRAPFRVYEAWVGVISFMATVSIAIYERRARKRLLARTALAMLGIWVAVMVYLIHFVPAVMVRHA